MRTKIGLFAIYITHGTSKQLLTRILAPDGATAIRQAKDLFKDKGGKNLDLFEGR